MLLSISSELGALSELHSSHIAPVKARHILIPAVATRPTIKVVLHCLLAITDPKSLSALSKLCNEND